MNGEAHCMVNIVEPEKISYKSKSRQIKKMFALFCLKVNNQNNLIYDILNYGDVYGIYKRNFYSRHL